MKKIAEIPPFAACSEGLMSLWASCPHQWRSWQILEFGEEKLEKVMVEWEDSAGRFFYREAAVPFSPFEFYEALRKEKFEESCREDFLERVLSRQTTCVYQLKNSMGECFLSSNLI